jgi:hypothetical protein
MVARAIPPGEATTREATAVSASAGVPATRHIATAALPHRTAAMEHPRLLEWDRS